MIDRFTDWLGAQGRASATIAAYRADLAQLYAVAITGPTAADALPALTADHLRVWRHTLDGMAPATRDRKLAAVRVFCRWLEQEGLPAPSGWRGLLAFVAREQDDPRTLTAQQLDALVAAPLRRRRGMHHGDLRERGDTPDDLRDHALLALLCATGARSSEIVGLDLGDLHVPAAVVRVSAGTRRERDLWLDQRATAALARYLEVRTGILGRRRSEALFVNAAHQPAGPRLTRQGFWLIVKGHAAEAGLPGWVRPGVVRGSIARALLAASSVEDVRAILGDARLATTQNRIPRRRVAQRARRTA